MDTIKKYNSSVNGEKVGGSEKSLCISTFLVTERKVPWEREHFTCPWPLWWLSVFLGSSTAWMLLQQHTTLSDGHTTQQLVELFVVAWIASCRWRGIMRVFLLSRAAFPASSRIMGRQVPSTRREVQARRPRLARRAAFLPRDSARGPRGNWSPAREERVLALARALPPCCHGGLTYPKSRKNSVGEKANRR